MKKIILSLLCILSVSLVACNTPVVSSSVSSSVESSSEVSSVESSVSSESSEESSSVVSSEPTLQLVEVFNFGFEAEYAGEPAISAPEEGEGFIVLADGTASTIDGTLAAAPAPSWTFVYGGYDKNMPEFEIEAKIKYGASTNDTSVYAVRVCYDGCYDIQVSAKITENGWEGVQIYQSAGALVAQHDDATKGGQITDGSLHIVPETDYVVKIRSMIDGNDNAKVTVQINDVLVIDVEGLSRSTLNANAKHGMGASVGSWIVVDYFKGSNVVLA